MSPVVAAGLSEAGHDAVHVADLGLVSAADAVILERARAEERMVVSADADFGGLSQAAVVGYAEGARGSTVEHGLVYLALQELATQVSRWSTGLRLDATGREVMRRVADENLHFPFYRDMVTAVLAADPSAGVEAIDRQVTRFEVSGAGIDGFGLHASIAAAGIYDLRVHHEQIVAPVVLVQWRLEALDGLSATAERARDHVLAHIARLARIARRIGDAGRPAVVAAT